MKKIISVLLAMALMLSFAACTKGTNTDAEDNKGGDSQQTEIKEPTAENDERVPYSTGYWDGDEYFNGWANLALSAQGLQYVEKETDPAKIMVHALMADNLQYFLKVSSYDLHADMAVGAYKLADGEKNLDEKGMFQKFEDIFKALFEGDNGASYTTEECGAVEIAGRAFQKFVIHQTLTDSEGTQKCDETYYIAPYGEYMLIIEQFCDIEDTTAENSGSWQGPVQIEKLFSTIRYYEGK